MKKMPGREDDIRYQIGGVELLSAFPYTDKKFGILPPGYRALSNGCIVLMRQGKKIIGFGIITNLIQGKRAELSHIGMLKGFRSHGFGTRLLRYLEKRARTKGYTEIMAVPGHKVKGACSPDTFFLKNGFQKAPQGIHTVVKKLRAIHH